MQIKILEEHEQPLSQWVTLVSRRVSGDAAGASREFHSFKQADYVSVLAITRDGLVPLVKQFRPAVKDWTLELPGGLLDMDEPPEKTAGRELLEETGYRPGRVRLLGRLAPDTGRLENSLWAYFATDLDPAPDCHPEAGVERIMVSEVELRAAILDGRFCHALHIAIVGMAMMRGLLK